MNPESSDAQQKSKLPYFLYELKKESGTFERLEYSLATSDSERISVEHVAKAIDPNARTSALSQNLLSTLNAIKILRKKVKTLIELVKGSEEVRKNHDFMRRLN